MGTQIDENETFVEKVDFALIKQKDRLIRMIDRGHFGKAEMILAFLHPTWKSLNYEYKYRELKSRIAAAKLRKRK